MSEDETKELINAISKEEFSYALAIAKAYEKLEKENEELKKQLEEYIKLTHKWHDKSLEKDKKIIELEKQFEEINYTCVPNSDNKNIIGKYKNQQKEFIKYLEDDFKIKYRDCGYRHKIDKEILSKYKEIIGDIEDE